VSSVVIMERFFKQTGNIIVQLTYHHVQRQQLAIEMKTKIEYFFCSLLRACIIILNSTANEK
jgi:hypothetical protein